MYVMECIFINRDGFSCEVREVIPQIGPWAGQVIDVSPRPLEGDVPRKGEGLYSFGGLPIDKPELLEFCRRSTSVFKEILKEKEGR